MIRDSSPSPLLTARRKARWPLATLAVALLVAMIVATLIWPIAAGVGKGFVDNGKPSTYWLRSVLTSSEYLGFMVNSLVLASAATALAIVIAVPLAMIRANYRFRGQGLAGILLLVPLILPPFVGAMSTERFLSENGVLNAMLVHLGILDAATQNPDWLRRGSFAAVCVLQALHLFPIMYLNVSATLANIDPAYSQAARNLGASGRRSFFRVTLPLMRPGLFAGGTIVFIWALTDIGTPLMVGYRELLPVAIFQRLMLGSVNAETYAMVAIMLSGAVLLYVVGKFVFGRPLRGESSKASVAQEIPRLGAWATLGAWAMFGGVILLAVLPHLGVALRAVSAKWIGTVLPSEYTLAHLKEVLARPQSYNAIINSLRYAGVSTTIDLLVGGSAAWLIVRSRARGRGVLDSLAMLPLAVPGMILAAGYLALTAKGSWLESMGPRKNAFLILVIAYSVRRLPFVVRGISAGLQQVPASMEEAARDLGSSRAGAAMRITIPLIAANLIAAAVLTFSFAMLEVSDSLMLAQQQPDYPITKEIYMQARAGTPAALNRAAAMGVYAMGLLGGTIAIAAALLGKKLGAIFRV